MGLSDGPPGAMVSVTWLNYLYIICQLIVVLSGASNHLSLDALLFPRGR